VAGPITMRIVATDMAGNMGDVTKELPGSGVVSADSSKPITPVLSTTSYSPTEVPAPVTPAIVPPAMLTPVPVVPSAVPTPAMPAVPTNLSPAPAPVGLPTTNDANPLTPIGSSAPGMVPAPVAPVASDIQHVRSPDFDLNYTIESKGLSGISRVDLYVTRDEGRSWTRWSSHDGKESPLKVRLGTVAGNRDGDYGLKLVPVSGVGVADDIPTAGTVPEVRVRVDTGRPVINIYSHTPSNQPNAVVLNWDAKDANFGTSPITLEWSEGPKGPWRSCIPEMPGQPRPTTPNTGSYTWSIGSAMPTHRVYLRVTATDLAGNVNDAITREPITIDLTKPRARIVKIISP
jgi:hypothetical protein